jgi:hypothetical protein
MRIVLISDAAALVILVNVFRIGGGGRAWKKR